MVISNTMYILVELNRSPFPARKDSLFRNMIKHLT